MESIAPNEGIVLGKKKTLVGVSPQMVNSNSILMVQSIET